MAFQGTKWENGRELAFVLIRLVPALIDQNTILYTNTEGFCTDGIRVVTGSGWKEAAWWISCGMKYLLAFPDRD